MASMAASALSNMCTSQSGTAARIFWGHSGCVLGGTMTILKPMLFLLLSYCLTLLWASYTIALACLPDEPIVVQSLPTPSPPVIARGRKTALTICLTQEEHRPCGRGSAQRRSLQDVGNVVELCG